MVRKSLLACSLAFSISAGFAAGAVRAEPEVFSKAGYEADRTTAVEQDRLHLVFVSSKACNSSQVLERGRWDAPEMVKWVEEHGIVTRVDLEESESKAKELGILVTPTLIVVRGDEELGRAHGSWWVEDLVQWLEHLRIGAPLDPQAAFNVLKNQSGTPILEWFFEQMAGPERQWLEGDLPFLLGEEEFAILAERIQEARVKGDVEAEVNSYLWLIRNGDAVFSVGTDLPSIGVSELSMGLHEGRFDGTLIRRLLDDIKDEAMSLDSLMTDNQNYLRKPEHEVILTWQSLVTALGEWEELLVWTETQLQRNEEELRRTSFLHNCEQAAIQTKRWDVLLKLIPDPAGRVQEMVEIPIAGAGFDMMTGGEVNDDLMNQMRDGVAWGLYHPFFAAFHQDDTGAAIKQITDSLEKSMDGSGMWRVIFLLAAAECDRLTPEYQKWIKEHDLTARYPQFAELLTELQSISPSSR